MSYAIMQSGGKQYKVKAGEILKIEKLEESKPESKIEFKEILAYGDDKNIEVGSPTVIGAKVEADLIENGKNRTILIFKKRRRQNSRRKNGHRQQYSLIRISKIFSKDGKILSEAEKMVKPTKKIERLDNSKVEKKIEFKEILAYGDDKTIEIGSPTISGAKVEADLVENGKDRTILIFKKRRRQNSRRKNGHRQQYSLIRIKKIFSKDGKVLSEAEKMVKPVKKNEKVETKKIETKAKTKVVTKKKVEAKTINK